MEIRKIFPVDIQVIGEVIKNRRQFLKLKQEDLAELAGVTVRSIHSIELGKGSPSFNTLEKIAGVLGMEIMVQVKNREAAHG